MKLAIPERLILLDITEGLEGDVVLLRVARDLRKKLGFSAEELSKFEIQSSGDGFVRWNREAAEDAEIELGEADLGMIRERFRKLNEAKKLKMEHLDLYERFVVA
jgi:hypothetical protein